MEIIKEQLGKIHHFLTLMIPLFVVNALFNLNYKWGGVSTIARVYIMVLSFYLIYIFSQIDLHEHKADYIRRFGWKGKYYLFLVLRIFPFLFIYFLTMIFTVINYVNNINWPIEPLFRILDGRYSNTIFYSLILFIVLKQKRRPGISIPLFIVFSIIYFIADHELYSVFEPGIGISVIKYVKYFFFIFVLVHDFAEGGFKTLKTIILSVFTASCIFFAILSIHIISFYTFSPGSQTLYITGRVLLKSGFTFTFPKLQKHILEAGHPGETINFFWHIEKYKASVDYTPEEWERIILRNKITDTENIFAYLNRKNTLIDFNTLKRYIQTGLEGIPSDTSELKQFIKYFSKYYADNKSEFFSLYNTGNETLKIIILKSLSYTADRDSILFLTEKLTSVNMHRSETAYNSLKTVTGKDPVNDMKKSVYDIDVVMFFRDYASTLER